MPGRLETYAFINAKLRTRLSKILSEDHVRQLARAPSLPEAIQLLRAGPFETIEEIYRKTGDLKMGELELFHREVELHLEVESLVESRVKGFVHALTARYEVEALKNALRLWFDRRIRGRSIESAVGYLYRPVIHHELKVDAIINLETLEEIGRALEGTPYAAVIRENAGAALERNSIFPIEIALDQDYYRRLLEAARDLSRRDREIAGRLIGVEIDLQNIDWIVRFKTTYGLSLEEALRYVIPQGYNVGEQVIRDAYSASNVNEILSDLMKKRYPALRPLLAAQGGEAHSRLVLIERILDHILEAEVRRALVGDPFTIGIILAYFILKRNELRRIMTILNAKFYQIPTDRIEGLL